MWTEETFQLVRDGIDAAKSANGYPLVTNTGKLLGKRYFI